MSDCIAQWLQHLGLSQYAEAFRDNAIEWDQLPTRSHDDLKELGVKALGHWIQIVESAKPLGAEVFNSMLEQSLPAQVNLSTDRVEAERRQLTVTFCDLIGSTALSQRLDPEDMRDLIRAYQDVCKEAIERYDGYVSKYMGDVVLASVEYPDRTFDCDRVL